ncbi:SLIT2 [Mytilus coruscus]|uniref:SLIT2 n=1 Tax=Mytilus coruscus TaxID=42192 RepID=A0A6J8B006_MYTCO|nr:SLIT2 [Mytilus coruscus]
MIMGTYTYCSPDGMKDLWCNIHSSCYTNKNSKYGFEFINQCLACKAAPEWEIPLPNVTYRSLDVEIRDVIGTESMLLTDQEFNSTTYFRFVHSDGYLKQLPRNICKFNIVLIDVSYNLFEEIGNISCLQTLDTLKMNENRITFVSNKTFAEMPKLSKSTCKNPEPLRGINSENLFYNTSLQHLMVCDVQDGCPKVGQCKCVRTFQPITDSLIIDCSNQSCNDLPDVVPDTRHKIVLFMEGNQIRSVNSKYYFKDVKILNLSRNPIQSIEESIQNFSNDAEIIITDHLLDSLPRQVQLLDPNVFRFGQNGIPCNCDNRWIGEWRKIKKARYPLFCSNFENVLIEDFIIHSTECDSRQDTLLILYSLIPLTIFIVLIWKLRHLRYDVKVLKNQFLPIDKKIQRSWQTDIYISFDEDNDDVRRFVLRRRELNTYIACRDSWPGSTDEQNIVMNLQRCKYCLIIQSSGMYDLDKTKSCTNRMEYRLAWDMFTDKKLCKVLVINFDKSKTETFQALKTKALYRLGMGFKIYDRKRSLNEKLLEVFNEPLVTNVKHIRQRKRRISAYLWQQSKYKTRPLKMTNNKVMYQNEVD